MPLSYGALNAKRPQELDMHRRLNPSTLKPSTLSPLTSPSKSKPQKQPARRTLNPVVGPLQCQASIRVGIFTDPRLAHLESTAFCDRRALEVLWIFITLDALSFFGSTQTGSPMYVHPMKRPSPAIHSRRLPRLWDRNRLFAGQNQVARPLVR